MSNKRAFDHIITIMFENEYGGYVLQNPYMKSLADQGICLENGFGVMHPSQTNYIASVAGALCNVTSDDAITPPLSQRSVVDLIEESSAGLRWKAYMDSYRASEQPWTPTMVPEDQCMPNGTPCPGRGPYVVKHNPFFSFENIIRNEQRWAKVDNEVGFMNDVKNGTLPEYCWFTPDMWNDGHWTEGTDQSPKTRPPLIKQLSKWLKGFFGELNFPGPNSRLPPRTLVVLTFDEADFEDAYVKTLGGVQGYEGVNIIYTVLLGDMISPGVVVEGYNHYSLLRTIEKNFALGDLGTNDVGSNWFQFLWGREFAWGAPVETPIQATNTVAAASLQDIIHVVYTSSDALVCRFLEGSCWSDEQLIGMETVDEASMACCQEELILVCKDGAGSLSFRTYSPGGGWSAAACLDVEGVGSFSVSAIDSGNSVMLAFSDSSDDISSMVYSDGNWSSPLATGHQTDGGLTLGSIGSSVYLIFKDTGMDTMSVSSYNTADFNVVTFENSIFFGPFDNMSKDTWSPTAFSIEHYTKGPNAATPGEVEPVPQQYLGGPPFVAASLDGVLHLVHLEVGGSQLMTETFSVPGILTPENKVSYDIRDLRTSSNGFGTLYQAGWNEQQTMEGMHSNASAVLALASTNAQVALFFQPNSNGTVFVRTGQYQG